MKDYLGFAVENPGSQSFVKLNSLLQDLKNNNYEGFET